MAQSIRCARTLHQQAMLCTIFVYSPSSSAGGSQYQRHDNRLPPTPDRRKERISGANLTCIAIRRLTSRGTTRQSRNQQIQREGTSPFFFLNDPAPTEFSPFPPRAALRI